MAVTRADYVPFRLTGIMTEYGTWPQFYGMFCELRGLIVGSLYGLSYHFGSILGGPDLCIPMKPKQFTVDSNKLEHREDIDHTYNVCIYIYTLYEHMCVFIYG